MNTRQITIYDKLCEHAKDITGIDISYIKRSRKIDYVRIRASIMVNMCMYCGVTTTALGKHMGLDHSSVVHHKNTHTGRHRSDDEYARIYDSMARFVRNLDEVNPAPELPAMINLIRDTL